VAWFAYLLIILVDLVWVSLVYASTLILVKKSIKWEEKRSFQFNFLGLAHILYTFAGRKLDF